MRILRNLGIGGLSTGLAGLAAFAATPGQWAIEAVEGAASVKVTRSGRGYQGLEGSVLQAGDVVETGAGVSARIVDSQGTEAVIGRGSRYRVLPAQAGAQWGQLELGHLRAQVRRPTAASAAQVRFAVKTRSSILGVRGTDFTVDVAPGGDAAVHTLEGKVEAARDEKALFAGRGVPIAAGEMLKAVVGNPIPRPEKFDREGFLQRLKGLQPESGRIFEKSVKPPTELQKIRRPELPPMPDALKDGRLALPPGGAVGRAGPGGLPGVPEGGPGIPGAQPGGSPPKPPLPMPPPKGLPPPLSPPPNLSGTAGH